MPAKLPFQDGESFIEKMEQAAQEGEADLIKENIPKLRQIVHLYQERALELAKLQLRARTILEKHEPPADKR